MKRFTLPGSPVKGFAFLLLLTGFSFAGYAQMKIGNNPTQIHPASILELESGNQALRLTQGDTTDVNTVIGGGSAANSHDTTQANVKAAEGMIMFQNSGDGFGLYMRVGGYWRKIMSPNNLDSTYFKIGGNHVTADSSYLGLIEAKSLAIGTDSAVSIVIAPDGVVQILDSLHALLARVDSLYSGIASIDTLTVNDSLNVDGKFLVNSDTSKVVNFFVMKDSVMMKNVTDAFGADTALLSIGPDGVVHRMSIDSLWNTNKPTINGITSNVFHLKMGSNFTGHNAPWIDSTSTDSTLIFNIPVASDTIRGLVDTLAQSFAGTKSFRDSVAIGTTNTPGAALDVHGTVNLATVITNQNYDLRTDADSVKTIIADVGSAPAGSGGAGITISLPTITADLNGRLYTIKKVGEADDNQIDATVVIQPSSSQTFGDGGLSFTIYNNFTSVTIQALGGKWYIVGH